jgi:hypothetical protein
LTRYQIYWISLNCQKNSHRIGELVVASVFGLYDAFETLHMNHMNAGSKFRSSCFQLSRLCLDCTALLNRRTWNHMHGSCFQLATPPRRTLLRSRSCVCSECEGLPLT